jgi:hypothetical protein
VAEVMCHTQSVDKLPEYIAINPVTLVCPWCDAKPGKVCQVLLGEELGIVHAARIKAAAAVDFIAKERLGQN